MNNNYKYYGNYDKNIKSIKGGGVITPSNPPNRINATNTIKNTWNNEIIPIPPLFKNVYYSDKNLTNGYLNKDNYIAEDKTIGNYYYPSQKFNKVINLKKNKSKEILNKQEKKLNNIYPLKFPPQLINSKPNQLIESAKIDETNNYIDYITNNTIYDGKYIYMLEDKPINIPKELNSKITSFPYLYKFKNMEISPQNIEYTDKINTLYEDFNSNNSLCEMQNIVLLVIFSVLLIIYFSIYKK